MEKIIKIASITILIISLMLLPFFWRDFFFGIAGDSTLFFILMGLGYLGIIVSSIVCIFRYKAFPAILVFILILVIAIILENYFKHDDDLCAELRFNPTCNEDECGFTCSNFGGRILSKSGSVCRDKDMDLCKKKINKENEFESETKNVSEVYSDIVDKIVASSSPAKENFENQLLAVYNCMEEKYGSSTEAEKRATQTLKKKNLSEQQLNKYYSYLSSKGRGADDKTIAAKLPTGDTSFSCEHINAK